MRDVLDDRLRDAPASPPPTSGMRPAVCNPVAVLATPGEAIAPVSFSREGR